MPTRMPVVNGIASSPAALIVSSRRAGCLVGEPACTVPIKRSDTDSSISPIEAFTSRSRDRSSRSSTPRLEWGRRPRSSARSQDQTTYAVKSSCPYALRRRATSSLCSGFSPVSTSSSLLPCLTASSSWRSTSWGEHRCGLWVANEQYLQ